MGSKEEKLLKYIMGYTSAKVKHAVAWPFQNCSRLMLSRHNLLWTLIGTLERGSLWSVVFYVVGYGISRLMILGITGQAQILKVVFFLSPPCSSQLCLYRYLRLLKSNRKWPSLRWVIYTSYCFPIYLRQFKRINSVKWKKCK